MIPIISSSQNEFDVDSFSKYILKTCTENKNDQKALAFAFIVYDHNDPNINKILRDQDYWNSLDQLSGKYLSVFYINSQDDHFIRRKEEEAAKQRRRQAQLSDMNIMSFVVPVNVVNTPMDEATEIMKNAFDIQEGIDTPFVLFFQTDGEDVTDNFIVKLKQDHLEDAFIELRDHINNAVDAVKKVRPEFYDNHQEIFNLIKNGIEGGEFSKYVKSKITSKLGIPFFIALISKIVGL